MNIDKLRALLAVATPGPWQYLGDNGVYPPTYSKDDDDNAWLISTTDRHGDDARLIAAMHAALPALLDRLEKLEAQVAIADDLVDHILTSGAMNPELALAAAYERAGKGEV